MRSYVSAALGRRCRGVCGLDRACKTCKRCRANEDRSRSNSGAWYSSGFPRQRHCCGSSPHLSGRRGRLRRRWQSHRSRGSAPASARLPPGSCPCAGRNPATWSGSILPTWKYVASGCEKYQPLTAAVGYIAKFSVRRMPACARRRATATAWPSPCDRGTPDNPAPDGCRDTLRDQLVVGEALFRRIAPELAAHALVHALGQRLGEPVGQRLEHDRAVVVVRASNSRTFSSRPMPVGHGERADVVARCPSPCGATKSASAKCG